MTDVAAAMSDDKTNEEAEPVSLKTDAKIDNGKGKGKEETESAEVENSKNGTGVTKLEADLIRQLEYYFGDANLNRDKFLLEQIGKDDGWVPISTLLSFKRLASLSTNPEEIVESINKSDEGLIEVSEDKLKLRRHPERPIPEHNEERRKDISSRTAYAKGFPLDIEMSEIIEFFNPYEKVVNITMRKYLDKLTKSYKFKGSVFITFAKKEQCADFIAKEKVEYKEKELLRLWQENYLDGKKEERNKKKKPKNAKAEDEFKIQLPKGAVLFFEGASEEHTTREHIRSALEAIGAEVSYIEYSKGENNGYIRLTKEGSAAVVLDKSDDKQLKLNESDVVLKLRALEGEEETQFLQKAIDSMKSRRNNQNKFNRGNQRSGNNRRDGGNNRKRRGERNDKNDTEEGGSGEPPEKQNKEDE